MVIFLLKLPLLFLRTVLRFFRDLDGLCQYGISKLNPPSYIVTGGCQKRGLCCHRLAVYIHPRLWKYPIIVSVIRRWYMFVYNFKFIESQENLQVLIFSCNYLKDNLCSIHWKRPFICRRYPGVSPYIRPTLLPGCGYTIESFSQKKGFRP